jgi:hypothetical protein
MRHALIPHADFRPEAELRIDVNIARQHTATLALHYIVTGDVGALRLPAAAKPARTHELWRSTCFEAYLRMAPDAGYYEFNFAPSTQWAAYAFDGYRSGMRDAERIGTPRIDMRSDSARLELQVSLDLDRLLPRDVVWQLGLSAVIEETDGRKSYWALAHPPGKPDFHHSDCFALEVPTA